MPFKTSGWWCRGYSPWSSPSATLIRVKEHVPEPATAVFVKWRCGMEAFDLNRVHRQVGTLLGGLRCMEVVHSGQWKYAKCGAILVRVSLLVASGPSFQSVSAGESDTKTKTGSCTKRSLALDGY
eukprot:1103734-Amphidinium_carterae.2